MPRFHIPRPLSRKLTNLGFTILNVSDDAQQNFPSYSKTIVSYLLELLDHASDSTYSIFKSISSYASLYITDHLYLTNKPF